MKNINILAFNAYYPPEVAASMYLSTNLYEDLAKSELTVKLYTPLPTRGVSENIRKQYREKNFESKYNDHLKIHRILLMKESKNPILRAIRYILMNLIFIDKGMNENADLIFINSTPPTQGAMAGWLGKRKKIPVIYNLQDIFPDSMVNTKLAKENSLIWQIGRMVEKYTYRNVDRIIVISEYFKNNLLSKGVPEEKIDVVYNWVDENSVKPIERKNNFLIAKYNLNPEKFFVVYAGNMGQSQNIDIIFDCAKELADDTEIQFLIFGTGEKYDYYLKKVKDQQPPNLKLFPVEPYENVSYVYSLGDVCLITCKKGVGNSGFPSKTWSILAAGSIPIASFDRNTELETIIIKNNLGGFSEAEETEELKNEILRFFHSNNREVIKENNRKFIVDNLSRKVSTQKIEEILKDELRKKQRI